jgi:hypothetical protein
MEYIKYIKYIDSFGIKFHFYTNNQPNYQNVFGGIMTFIYVLICTLIFINVSYEDINRRTPKSSVSEITDIEPRSINIKNEKIWIPFRIVTNENNYLDHRGKINIFPYLVEGIYNEKTGMELNYHLLKYQLCNETAMANRPENYKIDVPLNELFCISQDDIPLGGNWNGNYINYIEINLNLCEDGEYYNFSEPKCEKINEYLKNIKSTLSFDFYYPVVQFQPTNLDTPVSIIYRNDYYELSAYTHKLEKIFIQEHILSDDTNLLITRYKNYSCWGTRAISTDYYLSASYDPLNKRKLSQIFTMEIYLDYGLVYYKRTYNKLLFIISNVFPIFRLALLFFKKITQHIKLSLTKRNLSGLIFVNKSIQRSLLKSRNFRFYSNKNQSFANLKNLSLIDNSQDGLLFNSNNNNNNNNNNNINNSNINNSKVMPFINNKLNVIKNNHKKISIISNNNSLLKNDIISHNHYNNKLNISLNENGKKIFNGNEKEIPLVHLNNKPFNIKDSSKMQNSFALSMSLDGPSWKKKYTFPYYYFFFDFIFDKLKNPEKFFCLQKSYFTVYNFMSQIYDISTHIILFKQFIILNNFLQKIYEEKGYCPAHPFKKININDNILLEKINKDIKCKKSILFSHNFS